MNDMAEGLCARLYSAKTTLAVPAACPACVSGKDLAKVRDKLEKSFPDSADLTKVRCCPCVLALTSPRRTY